MGEYVFRLPDVGEGIAEAEIVAWHIGAGDRVDEGQATVDVMTDKATVEMTSPVTGLVTAVHGAVGQRVPVGSALIELETEAETPVAPAVERPLASPATRRRARERGIDLGDVAGSGAEGRVTAQDLDAHGRRDAGFTEIRLTGLRRRIAERMQEANRIPHFGYVEEFNVTELENLRRELNAGREHRLTLLPFFMRALVRVLPTFPTMNAHYDEAAGVLRQYAAVHAGVATQTPGGLMVPVVRHVERRDLWECGRELARVTEAARAGRAKPEELTGSTITLTSLGALGGIAATPVINPPEVAILGPNKRVDRPVARNGQVTVRTIMNLSASFDHRVVDGYDAARFIQELKRLIEQPALLFIEPEEAR